MNRFNFLKSSLFVSIACIVLSTTACTEQDQFAELEPIMASEPNPSAVDVVSVKRSKTYEWNGLRNDDVRCFNFPCDCTTAYYIDGGSWGSESDYNAFSEQMQAGTLIEWYASGEGQQILPLPDEQLNDLLNGIVTFKTFADGGEFFHLVYTNATDLADRPDYN